MHEVLTVRLWNPPMRLAPYSLLLLLGMIVTLLRLPPPSWHTVAMQGRRIRRMRLPMHRYLCHPKEDEGTFITFIIGGDG